MFKPTKKDLQQPVTVGDFVEFADFVIGNVAMKSDLAQVESRLKDEIYTSQDKVMKKLDIVLTELSAASGNVDQYRDEAREVKGLGKRVDRLEARVGTA